VFQLRTVANRKKPNLVRENLQSRNFMVPKPSALIRTPYLNTDTRPRFFSSSSGIDHYPSSFLFGSCRLFSYFVLSLLVSC
jgi:hypothetical protein